MVFIIMGTDIGYANQRQKPENRNQESTLQRVGKTSGE